MKKTDKPFITFEDQVVLLEKRNLIIEDKKNTLKTLQRYGYYEIINGYKDPFMIDPEEDDKGFKDGVTFEHIFAMFQLDKNIRKIMLNAIEEFELTFKQIVAYTISENISDNQKIYTSKSHYNAGSSHGKNKQTDRDRLLKNFNSITNSRKQPFDHYKKDHNNIPPWIMIKGLTFGQAIYWYKLSKKNVRTLIISRMFGYSDLKSFDLLNNELNIKQAFGDILKLLLNYRNLTAHCGRVYNHRSNKFALRGSKYLYREEIIDVSKNKFRAGKMRSSIGVLIIALKSFDNKEPYKIVSNELSSTLADYLKQFPEDFDYLIDEMELQQTEIYHKLIVN